MTDMGARIRTLRIARRMTQKALANKTFSVSYMSAIERGKVRPSLKLLTWCAERLDVPLAELLGGVQPSSMQDDGELRQRLAEDGVTLLRAAQLLASGQAEAALPRLRALHQRDERPAPPDAIWRYAYALLLVGEIEAATQEAERYFEFAQESPEKWMLASAYWLLGMIAAHNHQIPRAISAYKNALALEQSSHFPPDLGMLIRATLADALLREGNFADAYALSSQALTAYAGFANMEQRAAQAAEMADIIVEESSDYISAYIFARWAYTSQREANASREAGRLHLRKALLAEEIGGKTETVSARSLDIEQAHLLARQAGDEHTASLAVVCKARNRLNEGDIEGLGLLVMTHFTLDAPPLEAVSPADPLIVSATSMAQAYLAESRGDHVGAVAAAHKAHAALAALAPSDDVTNAYLVLEKLFYSLREFSDATHILRTLIQ